MDLNNGTVTGHHLNMTDKIERKVSDKEPFTALAFKIMSDPFVGKLTYFRIYSGTLKSGSYVLQLRHGQEGTPRAASFACTRTRAKTSKRHTPVTSWPRSV